MNDHLNPIIARALAPFTPPERIYDDNGAIIYPLNERAHPGNDDPVKSSLVIPCTACYGGWRDDDKMCRQCNGTGKRATNGGEA